MPSYSGILPSGEDDVSAFLLAYFKLAFEQGIRFNIRV
jgi:hypothetical protein